MLIFAYSVFFYALSVKKCPTNKAGYLFIFYIRIAYTFFSLCDLRKED